MAMAAAKRELDEPLKLYCFPLIVREGARRRLFFQGPATERAHELLCAAARDLRAESEAGASMGELVAAAFDRLSADGFEIVPH